jgi:hypothetical protein
VSDQKEIPMGAAQSLPPSPPSEDGVFERLAQAKKAFERATSLGLVRKLTDEEVNATIMSLIRSGESQEEARRIVMGPKSAQ